MNQHAGICATPPATDSTGFAIAPCRCSTPKHFTGDQSEMNKFDDMMAFLKQRHRQNAARHGSEIRLKQVVAMDIDFSLLSRVWCVAELVEADSLHLMQAVKLHSAASQSRCLDKIASSMHLYGGFGGFLHYFWGRIMGCVPLYLRKCFMTLL